MAIFYPLDLIRTRQHTKDGTGLKLRGTGTIFRQEGIRGLYRGCVVSVSAHSIGWGLYLTQFRAVQQALARTRGGDSSLGDFLAACVAACSTATLVTPLNLLKTRKQLHDDAKVKARGVMSNLRYIVRTEGFGRLFRGVGPQILLSSHTTIQVAIYEFMKRELWGPSDAPVFGVAFASAVSKGFASFICNPLEVLRTRLQDKSNLNRYTSMGGAFRTIWRQEGIAGLYRGVGVNIARVVPTTVAAFVLYEKLLAAMQACLGPKRRRSQIVEESPLDTQGN